MDHPYQADVSFDGGALDCGSGLLLLIRRHIDPLAQGQLLEIRSTEPTVEDELPIWCRMTGNQLVSSIRQGEQLSFLVCKGKFAEPAAADQPPPVGRTRQPAVAAELAGNRAAAPAAERAAPKKLPPAAAAPPVRPLSVMGVGSWPRPRWMLQAIHDHIEGRLEEEQFQETAHDAVRLCVEAQKRAGVDVVTDGEQRRDSYASFVGNLLDNCQLIPVTDLLPYVDDPAKFEAELRALDVPAEKVRHPAVFGPLGRSRPLTVHEAEFLRTLTDQPIKVALPGPYLLTRTMWMECVSDRAYPHREALAEDIVRVLREELHDLLAAGVSLVQFDEPVLTEVVFSRPAKTRTFMCGALGDKKPPQEELAFALGLMNRVLQGVPAERTAMHICRGNWTRDESVALKGDYRPLLPLLERVQVGTLMLELCTPRAGELEVLAQLPERLRIGVGVVNPKTAEVEGVDQIVNKGETAIRLFGADRVMLCSDCGFATFSDNPVSSAQVAERKLAAMAQAAAQLRRRHIA